MAKPKTLAEYRQVRNENAKAMRAVRRLRPSCEHVWKNNGRYDICLTCGDFRRRVNG